MGCGANWSPVFETVLPRDDGSHANDAVTDCYTIVWGRRYMPVGGRKVVMIDLRITIEDGSGSNTWTVEPVVVGNACAPSDDRLVWPVPDGFAGLAPPPFTEADLPIQRMHRVPARLGCYALRFTRTGAGTNRIAVKALASI